MKLLLEKTRRGTCLLLCGVILFLSYHSTTAILAVAGVAHNPTEGGIPGDQRQFVARENKPRPPKQRQLPQILRVKREGATNPDARLRKLLLLQENTPDQFISLKLGTATQVKSEISKPQYLRPFLPASLGAPHSPPG